MNKKIIILLTLIIILAGSLIAVIAMGGFFTQTTANTTNHEVSTDENLDNVTSVANETNTNNVTEKNDETVKSWKLLDSYHGSGDKRIWVRSDGNPIKAVIKAEPKIMGSPSRKYERHVILRAVQNGNTLLADDYISWDSYNPKFVSKKASLEFTINGEANIDINAKGVSWSLDIYSYS